jgi:hypothetical protein
MLVLTIISGIVLMGFLSWLSYIYRADLSEDDRRIKLRQSTIGIILCVALIGIFGSLLFGRLI